MPSFTSRHYIPERFRPLSKPEDDAMEDVIPTSLGPKDTASHLSSALTLVPSDGSLLDYFDLPSPPSTPQRPTHSLSFSSLNSFPSPSRRSSAGSPPSLSSSASNSPATSSSLSSTPLRWPTATQRIQRLPTRPRSRSASSVSSSGTTTTTLADVDVDVEMGGTTGVPPVPVPAPLVRPARRTPYYPPNASRNVDRTRVYMNRGPHYIPNWTPLGSLPRHVQLRIEERMVRFTAI
ncbi:hypothetical protein C8A03DRAFT_14937 [Achaetomium macrosporum]|uniref:Uncharacterized protein n=1 Tax=Achaetomium macrosporum TaxID=79813 RepID=A0AAN7CAU1_9PEZI|nr:hypothetical protein C8A03DRAFT_14937 [Achaetomium macrosporum]